jgi:capsular exopolysaccharide synthesis family protein
VTPQEFLQLLRRSWPIVVVAALLGLLSAFGVNQLSTPEYAAYSVLYVRSSAENADPTKAYQGNLLSEQKVKSYVSLVSGSRVRDEVTARIGGPSLDPSQLSASSEEDTVLLTIRGSDSTGPRAAEIANQGAAVFSQLVTEIESPAPNAAPPVSVSVVQNSGVPDQPVFPVVGRNYAIGLLVGLLLGVAIVFARNTLDRRVRSGDVLAETVGSPLLGEIPRSQTDQSTPGNSSQAIEAYNKLRTNLQFVDVDQPTKRAIITSSVPGEGKTTTTSGVAAAFARAGESVLVIEGDMRKPQLSASLGLSSQVGLSTILAGKISGPDATQRTKLGFDIIASGRTPPNPSELLSSQMMDRLLAELSQRYSYILIDTPPLLPVTDAVALSTLCDFVILVAKHRDTTTTSVRSSLRALQGVNVRPVGCVLNFIPAKAISAAYGDYYGSNSPKIDTEFAADPQTDTLDRGQGTAAHRPSPRRRSSIEISRGSGG